MTFYKRRSAEELLPLIGGTGAQSSREVDPLFQKEWINACKDGKSTSCDFDYAGTMMEQMILGLAAHRAGGKLEYDPSAGRVTNLPEANAFLSRKYRSGWTLDG